MPITIREIDKDILPDVNRCNATFTLDSKLVLRAEDGIITLLAGTRSFCRFCVALRVKDIGNHEYYYP
jgi:hypothetical protein